MGQWIAVAIALISLIIAISVGCASIVSRLAVVETNVDGLIKKTDTLVTAVEKLTENRHSTAVK
jgi:hypothetical protein